MEAGEHGRGKSSFDAVSVKGDVAGETTYVLIHAECKVQLR